jgi:hypothetical protein
MKRTSLARMSEARRVENFERRKAMKIVRARDVGCVGRGVLPAFCFGPTHGHEIITRAQGGSITDPRNILLLCDFHNCWVDLNHDVAVELGFRVSRTDPYSPKFPARLPIAPADATGHPLDQQGDAPAAADTPIGAAVGTIGEGYGPWS